jgi:TIR domain
MEGTDMQVGIAVDNTIPLHVPTFIEFIHSHSKTIRCHSINKPLRFVQRKIDVDTEIANLNAEIFKECKGDDLSLLLTTLPFANNFFYMGRGKLFIISFSDWRSVTTLPMSNGLAYMLCQILFKFVMRIGERHVKRNTGCVNDFLGDKKGIDVGMRAAFLCEDCKARSAGDPHLQSEVFTDAVSILNAISSASRREVDILFEPPKTGTAKSKPNVNITFDAFLCHNNQDKPAVRILNETLVNGGVRTWLDEKQIQPGDVWQKKLEEIISKIAACLVIVGDSGFGPWQDQERYAFISEFVNRGCKIIPVLIGNATGPPELPVFLRQFMWSDLRKDDGREVAKIISVLRGLANIG